MKQRRGKEDQTGAMDDHERGVEGQPLALVIRPEQECERRPVKKLLRGIERHREWRSGDRPPLNGVDGAPSVQPHQRRQHQERQGGRAAHSHLQVISDVSHLA
jgi:hypothetical protein